VRTYSVLAWAALFSCMTASAVAAQAAQRPIRGSVDDAESGQTISSVQIQVRGSTIGTVTDADGKFTLRVPEGPISLDVRRIGYQPATVAVAADQEEVAVHLKADVLRLNAEIITGQATSISRANSANDVASVGGEELTRAHASTLDNALQGKVAGVEITSNSGAPGGGMQIRMRGVTSIYGNSAPLYVIDGLPVSNTVTASGLNQITQGGGDNQDNSVNRIADLNPNDIASIEVLKGPSAAAIYGSEAANGVVVITTKKGQVGRPAFSFTQRLGTNVQGHKMGLRRFNVADAMDFAASAEIPTDSVEAWFQRTGGFVDFEKEVYGDHSLSYSSNLSVSGGSENTQYFMSGLAMHDNGIQYGTGYDKQSLRANLTQHVGEKLQIQVNTNLIHSLTKRGVSNNDNTNVSPYVVFAATPTFFDIRPVDGVYPRNPFLSNFSNPLQTIALMKTPEDLFRFMGSLNATYSVFTTSTQSLKATLDMSIDHYGFESNVYAPPSLYWEPSDGFPGTSVDRNTAETRTPMALTLAHTYTTPSNSIQATTSAGLRRGYDAFNSTTVTTTDLLAGQQNVNRGVNVTADQNRTLIRSLAWYAQEEVLLLDQRLLVSGGILGQRSTNNADVNKLFYYPKVAASYRWQDLGPFNEFKVRVAYGETGNEPLYGNKFGSLNGTPYTGQNGVQLGGTVADPDLQPEREKEIETGIDAALLDSRLAFSASYYQKNNTDLLLQARLAPSMGFGTRIFNGGEIRNRGVEAALTGFPVQSGNVSWMSRLTFSKNVGRVMSLPVPAFAPPGSFSLHFGQGFIEEGKSPSQLTGITAETGPGVHVALGDYEPDFSMGFSNEFNFGPVRLYGLLDWRHGGDAVNLTQLLYDGPGLSADTAAANDRLDSYGAGNSPYIQSTSFAKLREVTVSYTLPQRLVESAFGDRVSALRLEASGRNLYTWTNYEGLDPEVSNFGNQNINRSQDVAPYPPARSFFFTIGADF
jgi:TonB-dependent starch-binding outer membrane protein SusC